MGQTELGSSAGLRDLHGFLERGASGGARYACCARDKLEPAFGCARSDIECASAIHIAKRRTDRRANGGTHGAAVPTNTCTHKRSNCASAIAKRSSSAIGVPFAAGNG